MIDEPKDMLVPLCHNHFERLDLRERGKGDVCSTCPSRSEHRDVCRAISDTLAGQDPDLTVRQTLPIARRIIEKAMERI